MLEIKLRRPIHGSMLNFLLPALNVSPAIESHLRDFVSFAGWRIHSDWSGSRGGRGS